MRESMEEDNLEELRKKKLQELQSSYIQGQVEMQQQEQIEQQKHLILRQIMTPEARERLVRLKLARPDIAENVENQLIILASSGKLQTIIDDNTLKQILARIIPQKRDIKITRR